jgi:hypothetical protein
MASNSEPPLGLIIRGSVQCSDAGNVLLLSRHGWGGAIMNNRVLGENEAEGGDGEQ